KANTQQAKSSGNSGEISTQSAALVACRHVTDHIAMFEPAWLGEAEARSPDSRVAFRGTFTLLRSCAVEFRVLGASWFTAWIDGEFLTEGPARFPPSHPEYEIISRTLGEGRHVVAALVHHHGVETRMLRG